MRHDMRFYEQVLKQLVDAGGNGTQHRQGDQALQRPTKEGQVYAVLCPDNERYYRTVFLRRNYLGQLTPAISNAVYGEVPFGIEVVPAESITKHLRQTNLQNLNAGVFSGTSVPLQRPLGNELVSSLHQSLQGRSGR